MLCNHIMRGANAEAIQKKPPAVSKSSRRNHTSNIRYDGESMSTEHKSDTPPAIRDLWQTPKALFERLNLEFKFNMDVCASDENTLVEHNYWTEKDNSLKQNWGFSSWCNPPYSKIMPWVEKAISEHKQGCTVVMLVPSDPSVKWFKRAFETCNEVRFISGRIGFINAETQKPVRENPKGSVIFIWRAHAVGRVVNLVDRSEFE